MSNLSVRNAHFWSLFIILAVLRPVTGSSDPLPPAPFLEPGRVLVVNHARATEAFTPREEPVRQMVREGLLGATGTGSIREAWSTLVSPEDVVGIKVHSLPGRNSGTRLIVVAQVIETLLEAGFRTNQIVVWDRRLADLRRAGFLELRERYGIAVEGSVEAGHDPETFYSTPLVGVPVFGDYEFGKKGEEVGRNSYVSRLLTDRITRIINITPLLNHNTVGVSGILWGLALGSVDNVLRFDMAPGRLEVAIPEIYAMPELSDRVTLNIVDALICQYQGEERTLLHFSAALNELWFSRDPVALDVLAIEELQRQRKAADSPATKVNRTIYENAALLELGVADPRRIITERVQLPRLARP